jgi:hypothetical protein
MDSIAGTTKSSQDVATLDANISPKDPSNSSDFCDFSDFSDPSDPADISLTGDEREVILPSDQSSEQGPEQTGEAFIPNPYKYPEFAGYVGRAYLCNIVKQILPSALHDTWLGASGYQAPGNDVYVGNSRMQRDMVLVVNLTDRALRLRWHELERRGLVVYRPELRWVKQPDGSQRRIAVTIKDFSGLYDLAHEFHLWRTSPNYIPPQREYAAAIQTDLELTVFLCHFNCYKRIFNARPGRKPAEQISYEDELKLYAANLASQQQGQAATLVRAKDAEDNNSAEKNTKRKFFTNTFSNISSAYSKNRDHSNDHISEAAAIFRSPDNEEDLPAETIRNEQAKADGRETANTVPNTERLITEQGEAKSKSKTPNDLEEPGAGGAAAETSEVHKKRRKVHERGARPPLELPDVLENVLRPICGRFADQHPLSSKTSLEWLFADVRERGLDEQSQEFRELINEAYDKTNDRLKNGKIRMVNRDGTANAMGYFLMVLERDVLKWCQDYDKEQERAALKSKLQQGRWSETSEEETAGSAQDGPVAHEDNEEDIGEVSGQENIEDTPVSTQEQTAEQPQSASPHTTEPGGKNANEPDRPPQQQDYVAVEDPELGLSYRNAEIYADRVRSISGPVDHRTVVLPVLDASANQPTGKYAFVLSNLHTGDETIFVSIADVRDLELSIRRQRSKEREQEQHRW